jgi:acetyltransferase-like isoleucine patch superfamily enzyme
MSKIKTVFVFVLKCFCRTLNILVSYSFYSRLRILKSKLYTNWILNEFKSFGDKSFITYPIDLKGGKCIEVGEHVSIGKNAIINAWEKHQNDTYAPSIIIGNNTHLGEGSHVSAITQIIIGSNVLMGRRISIIDNSHGDSSLEDFTKPPSKRKLTSKGPIIIEDNVWIGDKVTILSGVTIGANSIVGANSVVTKDVPSNSIVGGVPAKLIKTIQ